MGYHDQQPPNKVKAFEAIKAGIDSYIHSTSAKMSVPVSCFNAWETEVLKQVELKLSRSKAYKYNNVLSQVIVKEELLKLKKDFVFIPVDKAAKNVCIICKKYYMDVISKEVEESNTFTLVSNDKDNTRKDIFDAYKGPCNLKDNFPTFYATAKMHKDPPSFRFITAGKNTIFSNVSIAVSKGLKLLLNTAKSLFKYRIKEVDNCIFIIDSRDKVIKFMDKANQSHKVNSVSTFDFSTLYTNIPHSSLKIQVTKFIRRVYNLVIDSKRSQVFVTWSEKSKKAYFSKTKSKVNISFSAEDLIRHMRIIIDNSFITFRNKIYRQVVGIPMGTNCAPCLADIFLHTYEYDYMQKLVGEGKIEEAKLLAQTFRFQDDCIALNDNGTFRNHYHFQGGVG